MKKLLGICLVMTAMVLAGCGSKEVTVEKPYSHGQFVSATGSPIALSSLAKEAASADYIIIAETHNNVHHHTMQADILNAIAQAGGKPVLGLEMLAKDKQGILEEFNKNKLGLEKLGGRLDWNHVWSFDYKLYHPVFKVAHDNKVPLVALNAPRSTARAVASDKPVPASELKWLPKRLLTGGKFNKTVLDKYRSQGDQSMTSSEDAKKTLAEYTRLRTLYECTMADAAVEARAKRGGPVVIMVGIENLRNGNFGLAYRIHEFDPSGKFMLVLPTQTPDKARFCSVEQPSQQAREALRSGAKIYYFCSLPGR